MLFRPPVPAPLPICPTTKDGAAFLSEAHTILGEFRSRFAALPASSALRQPCKWPGSDDTVDSWLALLERVLDEGLPTLGGDRFDRSVYGLSSEPANGLRIQRVGEQPTFFGSYPPPDDLDGQCIDLVAIAATDAAPVRVTARPRLRLQENMASFAEIRAMQNSQQDNTTLGALGLLPTEFGAVAPGAGIELDGRDGAVAKPLDQKVVISDHVPISFELHCGERHFTVLSMNLLANAYISYSFWNAEPPKGEMSDVWTIASRMRATADRKTKWLPKVYARAGDDGSNPNGMERMNVKPEELDAMEESAQVAWERINRRLFAWISELQSSAFAAAAATNPFAPDAARIGVLARLLAQSEDRPDFVLLQEVGMAELGVAQLVSHLPAEGAFDGVGFAEALTEACPAWGPLLEHYQIANVSPGLEVRRGGAPKAKDTGVALVHRRLLQDHECIPITHAAHASQDKESAQWKLLEANAGKPIVGIQLRERSGSPVLNLFGAHFEKGKTGQILQELVKAGRASSEEVPTVVTGDFNAVLLS